jgi:hypothetical protein
VARDGGDGIYDGGGIGACSEVRDLRELAGSPSFAGLFPGLKKLWHQLVARDRFWELGGPHEVQSLSLC